jgi:hypothetical protein
MPLLSWKPWSQKSERDEQAGPLRMDEEAAPYEVSEGHLLTPQMGLRAGWVESCAYSGCQSGWLHPWRNRSFPVFESGWTCSRECTAGRVLAALRREMGNRGRTTEEYRHRIPLGLLMLDQGWVSKLQLRRALEAQKGAGKGRLGQWLVKQGAVSERTVARALGMQWSCAVLEPEERPSEKLPLILPRFFVEAFGALPLRMAAPRLLYMGFEDRLDPVLALAVERMNGIRVESGVVPGREFREAHARMLRLEFPPLEMVEAAGETAAAHALARAIEQNRPVESRLIRVHDCHWLRMWLQLPKGALPMPGMVKDVICTLSQI